MSPDNQSSNSSSTSSPLQRRSFAGALAAATAVPSILVGSSSARELSNENEAIPNPNLAPSFRYCLNTSTIHGEVIPIEKQIDIAHSAGYDGIEIWIRDVDKYVQAGGKLSDLRKRIQDAGMQVESAIAFANWIVDDDAKRTQGLEQAKREMQIVVDLGGKRIAAPPAGATNGERLNLDQAAERYRALLEVGAQVGCVAQLEVWGFSKNLSRLSEVLYVAAQSQHADACILPDIYHLYKGGSQFEDLKFLAGNKVHVLHMNDYPDLPRDTINDADRVYPGDGVAPVSQALKTLINSGFQGVLSLELFNRAYWSQDPLTVAKTGLAKMKQSVAKLD
ncbi:MAG: sugar phosphate isomerase/epimerase [Pirellula sp.]|jgi:sugar phosphate isomerase/epimerase|nr:sugar phosphate isomerase/epimerase [Pirellula sp.]